MSGLFLPCQTDGCDEPGLAVVRDDPINGTRLCPDCLYDEGQRRDWW